MLRVILLAASLRPELLVTGEERLTSCVGQVFCVASLVLTRDRWAVGFCFCSTGTLVVLSPINTS